MNSQALKPCPFCGKELEVSTRRFNPHARCVTDGCKGAQLPLLNIEIPADVERWNTRVQPIVSGLVPDGLEVVERSFIRKDRCIDLPTVLVAFGPNDWDARDRFAAMLAASPSAKEVQE